MARQIDPHVHQPRRNERRQRGDRLVKQVRAGIAQRKPYDEGSLWSWQIRELKNEVWGRDGIRDRLRPKLAALGDAEGNRVLDALFEPGGLDANRRTLRRLKIDRLAARAVMINELVNEACEVLPEVEEARRAYDAARQASQDAEIAARRAAWEAGLDGRAEREGARRLGRDEVIDLLRDKQFDVSAWASAGVVFAMARDAGLITDTEFDLAARGY